MIKYKIYFLSWKTDLLNKLRKIHFKLCILKVNIFKFFYKANEIFYGHQLYNEDIFTKVKNYFSWAFSMDLLQTQVFLFFIFKNIIFIYLNTVHQSSSFYVK